MKTQILAQATRRILLAAAVATTATIAAKAAERNWSGAGSDSNWDTAGNWDSLPTSSDKVYFRNDNVVSRTATLNGSYTNTVLHVGKGSSAENPYIFEATDPSYGLTFTDDGWLGYYEAGWLWLKSGTYTFARSMHTGANGVGGGDRNPFWLKVGDGESDVTLNVKGTYGPSFSSSSVFVADKATLDFSDQTIYMASSSSAFITNSTMTVSKILLKGTSSMTVSGSTMTVGDDFNVADASGNNCTFNADSTALTLTHNNRVFNVGYGANSTGAVVKDGGVWSCYYLRLGKGSGSTGTFTMNDGTLEVKTELTIAKDASGTGVFNLNGGIVTASGVSATGTGTLTFNGGMLKARSAGTLIADSANLTVTVGANGGTIDSDNKAITVAKAMTGTGAMSFKGGNTITLTGANTYTGGTTIDVGTTVATADADAKAAVLDNGLVVDGFRQFTDGYYTVFEYTGGTLTQADLDNVTLVNCAVGSDKAIVDGNKIVVTFTAGGLKKTPTTVKVFAGKTLEQIKDGNFTARLWGSSMNESYRLTPDVAFGYNKKINKDGGGSVTNIIVEFQIYDGTYTKCVVASLTDDGTDVYATALGADYVRGNNLGHDFYSKEDLSSQVAETYNVKDYGAFDLHAYTDTIVVQAGETLFVEGNIYAPDILNYGTIVKTGDGTASIPFNNASTGVTIVSNGTLKVASKSGTGSSHTIRVTSGATFDVNGVIDSNVKVILEDGAIFANTGGDIGDSTSQTVRITLEGDATAKFSDNFGLLGPGYNATRLELGSNTFTINGPRKSFWLSNATITGDGTIDVDHGWLTCVGGKSGRDSTGTDCTLNIGTGGGLRIYGKCVLSVKNFVNGGTMYNDTGTLQVTGTLTPGNDVRKLTLANGATIKASATTAQTVTATFNASGTVTIDASEIPAATLRAGNVPVLTVPVGANTSSATWTVSGAQIAGTSTKWVTGETTKTLYLARPTGLVIVFQ